MDNLLKALESGQAVETIAERIAQKKKEHDDLEYQLLLETTQHPIPSIKEIRFFLNQFRKGDIDDPKYRQGLVDMLVNKIYLYNDKMTILCNTQDGHFDIALKEDSSLKGHLVEPRGVEPLEKVPMRPIIAMLFLIPCANSCAKWRKSNCPLGRRFAPDGISWCAGK